MRTWMLAALTALATAAAACSPSTPTEVETTEVPLEAAEPQPAPELAPMSSTAESITGPATFGQSAYTFGFGQRYAVAEPRTAGAGEPYGAGGDTWAALLQLPEDAEVTVVRVVDEQVPRGAPNGGLCGKDARTAWIAVAAVGEGPEARTAMAAFQGAIAPGSSMLDASLCGTFNYIPKEE
ncbi:MAG TPA: hypothetical protein VEA15_03125 [Caulobacteraceae bacterium]|nr:hypothetical protein [Caulobacteraceae bacterium]